MSTNTKLLQDVTQYYKNITSPIGANARIQRDIQLWTIQKMLTSYKKKTRETSRGTRKERTLDGQSLVYDATAVQLWSTESSPRFKLQELNMQVQGSQNSLTSDEVRAKWRATTSTRVIINPSQKAWKLCREHRHTEAGKEAVSKANIAKPIIQAQITNPWD